MPMETFDINTFRAAAPYIYAHQGSTFVITLPTEIVTSDSLGELIQDLALMQTLGIKLIIVFDTGLFRARSPKVVDHNKMIKLQHLIGEYQTRLESLFSTGLVNTPMAGMKLTTVSQWQLCPCKASWHRRRNRSTISWRSAPHRNTCHPPATRSQ